jgi:ADP-heptose:LPS heptosyltransferase
MSENLVLHCKLSPGDILTLTAAVESLHKTYPGKYLTDVDCPVMAIWENNPHITKLKKEESRTIEMEYPLVHKSDSLLVHFLEGYTRNLGEQLKIPLSLTTNHPHLYLSEQEKKWRNQVKDEFDKEIQNRNLPFWLINAGIKDDFTAKQWPIEYYQEVINKTQGRIQWVQVGAKEHNHVSLSGVLNLYGKTDHRQLIRLAYHSQGGLGPSTYLQHLMAAWEKPYICLLGGREPVPWVQYSKQTTLHTIGALSCCKNKACWKSRVIPLDDEDEKNKNLCEKPVLGFTRSVGKCMAMIKPKEVLSVLEKYYV